MTSSPLSPRILKGALVSVSATRPIPSVIIFQYNPDTLTRSIKPRAPGGDGARSEAMRLTGPPEETIKVDVEIDAVDQLEKSDGIATNLGIYPQLSALNVMRLASPSSAVLSAVIFNALVIIFLIPLALKGVKYRAVGAALLLRRNLAIYGLGGVVVPFVGIKLIDLALVALHLA